MAARQALADAVWPDVPPGALVLVPVGSTEQHGPHLPLDTDTVIAHAVARRAADALPGPPLVAPPLAYGASGYLTKPFRVPQVLAAAAKTLGE